jgi:catechol 2,3-dioxygenase-like lactoylglutathione lyase family enzyme
MGDVGGVLFRHANAGRIVGGVRPRRRSSAVHADRGWRLLRVQGRLDFSLVGVLAGLTTTLANANISVFAVSTHDTDYLLVRDETLDRAVMALRAANHVVTAASDVAAQAQPAGRVAGFDHVALPMQNTDAMVAFYRALGFQMTENPNAVSVHVGAQMINFHRPTRWQDPAFTLRARAASPPCGDLCFVWDGSPEALHATLDAAGAKVEEGPVDRQGARRRTGSSVYVRDPDHNLLEFMIYS